MNASTCLFFFYLLFNLQISSSQHIPDKIFAARINKQCPRCIKMNADSTGELTPAAAELKRLDIALVKRNEIYKTDTARYKQQIRRLQQNQEKLNGFFKDSAEIQKFKKIFPNFSIEDVKTVLNLNGIEGFKNLVELNCSNNDLKTLPALPETLQILICVGNNLTKIEKLSPALTKLDCSDNQLTELPFLPVNLLDLDCEKNYLTAINISQLALERLSCSDNQLYVLPDLPKNLLKLDCNNAQLTIIPALPNGLIELECAHNLLEKLPYLPDSLRELDCSFNRFTTLQNLPDRLKRLACTNNLLKTLPPLGKNLSFLDASYNEDLSYLPLLPLSLIRLLINNCGLMTLPNLPIGLRDLRVGYNHLIEIPELPFTLNELYCAGNQLTKLPDLSIRDSAVLKLPGFNPGLIFLDCSFNHIKEIKILSPRLLEMNCAHNEFKYLPQLPESLETLNCSTNFSLACLPHLPDNLKTLEVKETIITCLPNKPKSFTISPENLNKICTENCK